MNARLYDPLTGRMFSPDPVVADAANSQAYNKYSYVINNPLKYTDPTGEFFVTDSWIAGFVHGFFSSGSNRWKNAVSKANTLANNDIEMIKGKFAVDRSKSFGGQVLEIFSRFTWQLPQHTLGYRYAQVSNLLGNVNLVDHYGGATVIQVNRMPGPAVTMGNYIIGRDGLVADPNHSLFQHEYGHYLQSQAFGPLYLTKVGMPSLFSKPIHDFNPTEQDANVRAYMYFTHEKRGFDPSFWQFRPNPILDFNYRLALNWRDLSFANPLWHGIHNIFWYNSQY